MHLYFDIRVLNIRDLLSHYAKCYEFYSSGWLLIMWNSTIYNENENVILSLLVQCYSAQSHTNSRKIYTN
jgi:hypothetical protein